MFFDIFDIVLYVTTDDQQQHSLFASHFISVHSLRLSDNIYTSVPCFVKAAETEEPLFCCHGMVLNSSPFC